MAQKKPLKPLSKEARELVTACMAKLGREGYAIWGFVFAHQPSYERMEADGQDFTQFEVFNNAGEDSIPSVIVKTESALDVLRKQAPMGVKIEDEFNRVMNEINSKRPEGSKITFDPHNIN